MYGSRTDFVRQSIERIGCIHFAGIQCFGNSKRLHGRTGFNHVGYSAITALFAIGLTRLIRIVSRAVDQSQNLAGLRIQYHNSTRLGFVISHRFVQLVISQRLNTLIQRQNHVLAVFRHAVARRVEAVNDIAFVVAQYDFRTIFTAQTVFTGKLQAFLTFAVDIGKTDNVCKQIAHRVMAFQFFLEGDAFNAQCFDFFCFFIAELTFQVDKAFVFFRQFIFQNFNRHIGNGRQFFQLLVSRHFLHTGRHGIQ